MAQRAATDPAGGQFWDHRNEVRAVARRVLRDAVEAEDVTQEALLRALCNSVPIDDDGRGAWLTVVGRRVAIDVSKQRQRTESVAEPIERLSLDADPAVLAENRELLTQVWHAVGRLSSRQQRLLLGQVVAGLSLDQLAAEEDTTVASVRSVLARARESMRAFLHDTGWLAALTAHRGLSAARDLAGRVIPQLPRETGDALGAIAAAVALFLGHAMTGGAPAPAQPPGEIAASVAPATEFTSAPSPLLDRESLLRGRGHLLDALPDAPSIDADGIDIHQVIPFSPTESEIIQFAVAPDQQTVLAHGGWVETRTSVATRAIVKEWEPTLYRSDNGGRHWTRIHQSGFAPGRVLFAPGWPVDSRVFVITDTGVIQSTDGGRTFRVPPATDDPGATVESLRETARDPRTTVRGEQPAPLTSLRPAVLSPRFSEGDERIYLGGDPNAKAEVFDVKLGIAEPLVSVPPWTRSRGIAAAPDYAASGAVLVGAVQTSASRGAVFRCAERQCSPLKIFEDISESPGVFTSPNDPGLVYAWTTYAAYRSTDAGLTWHRQVLGPVVDLMEVGGRLVFLSLSGVPVSDDRGASWRELRILYSISAVAPIGRKGLLLAAGSGMACSPDRGETWLPACA